jgi:threonine aldolase
MATLLDFRSDTVTRPDEGMRRAMAAAEVGDDVFGEDPTVARLEERVAALFGREAALLVPSGTMANLIAVGLHCRRGDEAILERRTHTFGHETGGIAGLLGVMPSVVDCAEGWLGLEALAAAIHEEDIHHPRTRLAVVENTANLAGGLVVPLAHLSALAGLCRARGLALHCDGARIWNAAAASGTPLADYGAVVDTLACCLSKGLGCPAGSLLVGDRAHIGEARRLRKMLGGAMRQAGVLAAAGLHALDVFLPRLAEDHQAARRLAHALRLVLDESCQVQEPESNIVLVRTLEPGLTTLLLARWEIRGIRALALDEATIRLVTHHDLPADAPEQVRERLG